MGPCPTGEMSMSDTIDGLSRHDFVRGAVSGAVLAAAPALAADAANMSGGYDPTQTDLDGKFFKTMVSTFTKLGTAPLVAPRSSGSWPGYRFSTPPLSLLAGGFGLGHGTGAQAPDEYYLINSSHPA